MSEALLSIELKTLKPARRGKVRDIFDLGDTLLIVATDRVSAFDVVMNQGIPDKGRILTALSNFWFAKLSAITPNHLLATELSDFPVAVRNDPNAHILEGRAVLVRKTEVVPIECVARGYLAGSGWREYKQTGAICGIALPAGLRESERLPEPIFTPATKAQTGHDENITFERVVELVGADVAGHIKETTLNLYSTARDYAEQRGVIIADTKFEFGSYGDQLLLIDEALTPDSSRFWPAAEYEPGRPQRSFDKQPLRDYLDSLDWNKQPPPPDLPQEVIEMMRARYVEAYERITGEKFR